MSKRMCLWAIALVIAVTVPAAYAAAVRLDLVKPKDTDVLENASGSAILNYAKGNDKTIVQINCRDLFANVTYEVQLRNVNDYLTIGTITAAKNGTGTFHTALAGDHSFKRIIVRGPYPGKNRVLRSFP